MTANTKVVDSVSVVFLVAYSTVSEHSFADFQSLCWLHADRVRDVAPLRNGYVAASLAIAAVNRWTKTTRMDSNHVDSRQVHRLHRSVAPILASEL